MDSRTFRRRTVALIAAYAVALQLLLATVVPAAPDLLAEPFSILCSHDAGGTGQPAHHDLPCAAMCAAMGHGVSGPAPPGFAVAAAEPRAFAELGPVQDWAPPRIAFTGNHAPRGPPSA